MSVAVAFLAACASSEVAPTGLKAAADAHNRGDRASPARALKSMAEQGNPVAQFNLGALYHLGRGVPQDYVQAVHWYRKAAEQGSVRAQFNLGEMYYRGKGIPKNLAQAARWLRSAAEQGDARAQLNLGIMFHKGQGIPRNPVQAAHWYKKAAEQGQTRARLNLGIMYYKGHGVPKDPVQAELYLYGTSDVFEMVMSRSVEMSSRQMGMLALKKVPDETFSSSMSWLAEHAAEFAPEFLYEIATRLLKSDPDAAEFWWFAGRLRLIYDVMRCTDKSAGGVVGVMNGQFGRTVRQMNLTLPKKSSGNFEAALDWDINNPPHRFPLLPVCLRGLKGMGIALKQNEQSGRKFVGKQLPGHVGKTFTIPTPKVADPSRWVKPVSEHPRILKEFRDGYRKSIAILKKRG